VVTEWDDATLEITITDDGPGFAPDVLARIGEPYVTTRRRKPDGKDDQPIGLGLGFFIAKTLLERSGAAITFANQLTPKHGAIVKLRWNRADFERMTGLAAT
jgi:two-component system sensor histidine kinase RegB